MNDQNSRGATGADGRPTVASISAGRSDTQIAADYRTKTLGLLEQLAGVITEARKDHDMIITFQISGADSFGRSSIMMLEVSKKLC